MSLKTKNDKQKTPKRVLLAGNPNVGKSTIFNALTGLNQHTGNWTGKTVGLFSGTYEKNGEKLIFTDLPGCYSLSSRSKEEQISRDAIYFSDYDCVITVLDASCLERNLNLTLQILEACEKTCICINLADEAKKKGIQISPEKLSRYLGVPVNMISAKKGKQSLNTLDLLKKEEKGSFYITYSECIENYIKDIHALLIGNGVTYRISRLIALRILDSDRELIQGFAEKYGISESKLKEAYALKLSLVNNHFSSDSTLLCDSIAQSVSEEARKAANVCTEKENDVKSASFSKIDKLLIGRLTAFPLMFVLLFFVLWLTIKGANYPSQILKAFFERFEEIVFGVLTDIKVPKVLSSLLCEGVIRVVGWVVSVMLPPMAIFFPLFTLLEDVGYLPRVAFNLDKCFKGCNACGKQALTMCMGLGCNAAGVVGCRIIDSKREKDIAILTNSFMPCNGRFPMLIAVIGIFFASNGIVSALILAGAIVASVAVTLISSRLLSKTVLKGVPSSFTLELPSFRAPNIPAVIVRSVFDRTLFVLGRAVAVAAPTGLVIWLMSNITLGSQTLMAYLSSALNGIGLFIGLDGVIILAFIMGLPANEIVIPIMLMAYTSGSSLNDYSSLSELKNILLSNGWTIVTAVNFIIFTLFHWPCSTTVLTVKKETGSIKKTAVAVLLPTMVGVTLCLIVKTVLSIVI